MIVSSTLHNHCNICDGRCSPEEMIAGAVAAGFTDFGLSCHSHAPFDLSCCLPDEAAYLRRLQELQAACQGRINLVRGTEQDYFAPAAQPAAYDYIIGSVHYFRDKQGGYHGVDGSPQELRQTLEQVFDNDVWAMVADYYANVTAMVQEQRPDIIGHFDLIKMNNGGNRFFDESDPRYRELALTALTKAAAGGAIFEVNTAPLFKGLSVGPYPSAFLLQELIRLKAPLMINADAHSTAQLTCGLEETARGLKELGCPELTLWQNGGFTKVKL